jgi:hypothetical protein
MMLFGAIIIFVYRNRAAAASAFAINDFVSCDVGIPNLRWLDPFNPSVNSSTVSSGRLLTDAYDVYIDGRMVDSPSRSPWKIQSKVSHIMEAVNGPYYEFYSTLMTTTHEIHRGLAPCFPSQTPQGYPAAAGADDYTQLRDYYYSNWAEITSCPYETNFMTNGYHRNSAFVDAQNAPPGENTTCTIFQTDQDVTDIKLDITMFLRNTIIAANGDSKSPDFMANYTYAYGQIILESVGECMSFGDKCGDSDECCLGYACIRKTEDAKSGKCGQCKLAEEECFAGDECCDGLVCMTGACRAI